MFLIVLYDDVSLSVLPYSLMKNSSMPFVLYHVIKLICYNLLSFQLVCTNAAQYCLHRNEMPYQAFQRQNLFFYCWWNLCVLSSLKYGTPIPPALKTGTSNSPSSFINHFRYYPINTSMVIHMPGFIVYLNAMILQDISIRYIAAELSK